jgi:insertion element IS1 protein InsB
LPPLEQTLAPSIQDEEVLELDELWSFVLKRHNKRWIWLALCRRNRQVVAYAIGDRSERTCRSLWKRIPEGYRKGLFYSEFWESYWKVLAEGQHRPVGKSAKDKPPTTWSDGTARWVSAWGVW